MESKDYFKWLDFISKTSNTIDHTEYMLVMELHAKYFNHKFKKLCKCKGSAIQKWIDELNEFFEKSPKPKIR